MYLGKLFIATFFIITHLQTGMYIIKDPAWGYAASEGLTIWGSLVPEPDP